MAVSFQIDGSNMPYDPWSVQWKPADVLGRKHSGGFLNNAKRTCTLSLPDMGYSNFGTLAAKCNTASHTIKIPHPDTGTYTTFATAYLRLTRPPRFEDISVYDIEIEVSFVTLP